MSSHSLIHSELDHSIKSISSTSNNKNRSKSPKRKVVSRSRSRSPKSYRSRSTKVDRSRSPRSRSRSPKKFNKSKYSPSWGPNKDEKDKKQPIDIIKPNFELSGKLYAEKMTVNGVVLKYAQPNDSVMPISKWRMYVFKPDIKDPIETLYLHRQQSFLIGRDKRVVDIPVDHLSISSQHCVLQFRRKEIPSLLEDEISKFVIKLYIMDLESTHGTYRNGQKLTPAKYYELRSQDVVKLGESTREYVIMDDKVEV